mmetsp:Transcript_29746/g.98596  ORF Transcript_29746/g.98596 Transcript_29746/m.98596 type:complete len:128 (-) Transcript_29746:89-472(-)
MPCELPARGQGKSAEILQEVNVTWIARGWTEAWCPTVNRGGKHADLGTNHRLVAMVCRSFEEANGHFTVFCNTRKNPGVQCMFFDDGNDERTAKVWNWSDVPRYCGSEQFVPTLLLYEAINEHTPNL